MNIDDIEAIEQAFFNHDHDGSEPAPGQWEKRRDQWRSFKAYLSAHLRQEISGRDAYKDEMPNSDYPKQQPEPDPHATLKAYAKAGARIRFEDEFGWSEWASNEDWSWTQPPEEYQVHPADLHLLEAQPWTPKPGDVVQLKSGGPRMTVRLSQDENYLCTWTSDYGVFERFFPLACLQQA